MLSLNNNLRYPKTVTSYDLWKTLAIILMVVDHIGAFFMPENETLRVIGRLCVPIWFFLIGYAATRDVPVKLWAGALVVLAFNAVIGMPLLSLNIVFTFIAIRYIIDPFMQKACQSGGDKLMACLVIIAVYLPSVFLFEYGAAGFALAILGYVARRQTELRLNFEESILLICAVVSFFSATQWMSFGFTSENVVAVFLGCLIICLFLFYGFKPYETAPKNYLNTPVIKHILFLCGRYSLEIYVIHLCLFKFLAAYYGFIESQWFEIILVGQSSDS